MNDTQAAVLDRPKRDRRSLPLGLKRYRAGVFEQLHGAGSGVLTASQVPALFGQSRFVGRYALAAHISGKVPLPHFTSSLTEWGKRFEQPMLAWVAEDQGWDVDQLFAYAQHPKQLRLAASPDGLAYDDARPGPGMIECKVVADFVYERLWQDGPPVEVLLQHQTQLACTGARWGAIAVLVLGSTRRDPLVFTTEPNERAHAMILDAADALFRILDAGEMPLPDDHKTSVKALHTAFPRAVPGRVAALETDEAVKRWDMWNQAILDRQAAEKAEKAQRNWFFCQDPQAEQYLVGREREVMVKVIERKESRRVIPAGTYRRWDLNRIGEDKE